MDTQLGYGRARIRTQAIQLQRALDQPHGHSAPANWRLRCAALPSKGEGPRVNADRTMNLCSLLAQFPGASHGVHYGPLKRFSAEMLATCSFCCVHRHQGLAPE